MGRPVKLTAGPEEDYIEDDDFDDDDSDLDDDDADLDEDDSDIDD